MRLTGWTGVAAFLLTMAVIPMWFVDDGAPSLANVLLRSYVNMFVLLLLLMFWVGFHHLARPESRPVGQFWSSVALVSAGAFVTLTFVSEALQVGAVLAASGTVDPTRVGGGAEGALFLFGPVARLLTAATLISGSVAVLRTGIAPFAVAILGFVVGGFHLLLTATLFAGREPSNFLSINGWNIPVAGGLYLFWVMTAGVAFVRSGRSAT